MTKDIKKDFYAAATDNILSQIKSLGMNEKDTEKALNLARLFRASFKLDSIKKKSFVTQDSPYYNTGYYSAGFCRIASAVFMVAMGAADWDLMVVDSNQWDGGSHHFLRYRPNGKILDLTYDQFAIDGKKVPYDLGYPAMDPGATIMSDGKKFANAIGLDLIQLLKENSLRGK